MKRKNILIATSIWLLAALLLCSCDILGTADSRQGELRISFAGESGVYTRTQGEIPDTSDFILKVTDSKGAVVYDGLYGAAPESKWVLHSGGSSLRHKWHPGGGTFFPAPQTPPYS